ncbi:hypothetical protein Tcan_10691 [Toxocara canis]|uniref:Uncharacterized protein n=1 Tax=Toxocara canis TaxID=6265 RepID=A0A0B2VNY7_TOXCA|nr:hypothetical protein Tcan_10691 [Toxocara canis]
MLLIDSAMANTIVLLLLLLVITSDGSNQFATNSSRPRAAGYRTFVQGPNFAKVSSGQRYE